MLSMATRARLLECEPTATREHAHATHATETASATLLPLTTHAHGIDLIDEDDALTAPICEQPSPSCRSVPNHEHVHADEGLRNRCPGWYMWCVEARGNSPWRAWSRSTPGGPEEEGCHASRLPLRARSLRRSPRKRRSGDLALSSACPRTRAPRVTAEVHVASSELDLADAHGEHRSHEQHHVGEKNIMGRMINCWSICCWWPRQLPPA